MQIIDFLSESPKSLIFEKKSNSTNLGGVFTLIYFIIVIIISATYIFDYVVNPKYDALYTYEHFYNYEYDYVINKYEHHPYTIIY